MGRPMRYPDRQAAPSRRGATCKGGGNASSMRKLVLAACVLGGASLGAPAPTPAQTKPEGEMRFAVYVTLAPAWLDPGEAQPGFVTPFWVLVALHDALVKPMPGQRMAPSLAESWAESEDKLEYEFNLRKGLKFHNGDPFTA